MIKPPSDRWAVTTLEHVVDILDSKRVPVKKTDRDKRPGNVPYYGATGLAGWIDKPIFNEELLLLGEDGAPFLDPAKPKSYIIRGPAWVNNHAHVLRAVDGLTSNEFLKHQLDWTPYSGHVTGTTRLKLTQRAMRQLPILLPGKTEQERIVAAIEEHFSRLDAVHSTVEAIQQKLEAFRRSSFQELFARTDWPWTTLGQIAEVKGGVTKDSKNQGNPTHVEVPYLRVANVQRGFLDLDKITTIRVNPEKARKLRLQPGDILFNEGGDRDKLGRGWVWEGQVEDCIHQNHVFRARLTNDAFDPYFVSMHGNTWGQQWFETHGKQTTNLASLNLTTLKSLPVPAPSLLEQREVVGQLREVTEMENSLRADLTQAKHHIATLRQSILSTAFSGQLVPQDPNDEPASALLEHIARARQGSASDGAQALLTGEGW